MYLKISQYQAPRLFNWMRKMGKRFPFLWRYLSGVCKSCGAHVSFNSVVSRFGFQCWPCNEASRRKEGEWPWAEPEKGGAA